MRPTLRKPATAKQHLSLDRSRWKLLIARASRPLLGTLALFSLVGIGACPPPQTGGPIHGTVHGIVGPNDPGQGPHQQALPDVPVYAQPVVGRGSRGVRKTRPTAPVKSDLDGHYVLPKLSPGSYKVCWNAAPAVVPGCAPQSVTVTSGVAFALPTEVTLEPRPIHGRVFLKDGSPCRFLAPDFGVDLWADVALNQGGLPLVKVRANSQGEYLLPTVPGGPTEVEAHCEAEIARVAAPPGARVDIGLRNSRPRATALVTLRAGQGVRAPAGGELLEVRALGSDPDGDPLRYAWRPSAASAPFSSVNAPSVKWALPANGGQESMYALLSDGRGGYARVRTDLPTDGTGIAFSGTVVDGQGGAPVADALIVVNGTRTETNSAGFFALHVPEDPRSRYVLDADKDGYEPALKVTTGGLTGTVLRLYRAMVVTIDPNQDVSVEDNSNTRNRQRASLRIAAGSLVDEEGRAADGPLQLEFSTYDLSDVFGRWPGDGGGVTSSSQDAVLSPYGTLHVEIKDSLGRRYNLAPGNSGRVSVNIHPDHLRGPLPATMPAWTYDREAGLWREDADVTWKRVGDRYEVDVHHFSS